MPGTNFVYINRIKSDGSINTGNRVTIGNRSNPVSFGILANGISTKSGYRVNTDDSASITPFMSTETFQIGASSGTSAPIYPAYTDDATLSVSVLNSTGGSMTSFIVQLKDNPDSAWYNYLGNTDFDSTTNANMIFASASGPHEAATGATSVAKVKVPSVYGIRFIAAAGSTGNITISTNVQ